MFNKLVASGGQKRGFWSARSATVSITVHGLLIAGAAYASVAMPQKEAKVEEEVTFIEIEEQSEAPEPPPVQEEAPPPPPPPEAPMPDVPPPPQGFQELLPPMEPPPVIPDVDTSQPAVRAEDFSGLGIAGGTATGVEGGTPQNAAAPVDSVFEVASLDYDSRPELSNRNQVGGILAHFYPRMLQDAGIGGQVVVQFVITSEGRVDPSTVRVIDASHEQFASATKQAVERFRFRAGRYQGRPVPVLIQLPVTWQVDR